MASLSRTEVDVSDKKGDKNTAVARTNIRDLKPGVYNV